MFAMNSLLMCDTYKTSHIDQYPKSLCKLYSYWVPRKTMFETLPIDKMAFFGLQAFVKEFLIDHMQDNFFCRNWKAIEESYRKYMNLQLGEGNYKVDHIRALHELGYLPLEIKAVPEGTLIPMGVPAIEVTNTHEDFAWVVQWIECIFQAELWKTCNHATIGKMYYDVAKKWYDDTTDGVDPRMACSDFGFRGMSCTNEAMRCSAAWLLSFNKTSTIPALPYIDQYYHADCSFNHIGIGALSTEHSVVGANFAFDGDERTFLRRMLTEIYPNASFSFVSDTYDYWNVVDNIIPSLKDEILAHNGKLLVRPDSGEMEDIATRTVVKLWDTFGGTVNKKGYKVLDPHIGIIYGEGCTLKNIEKIWKNLKKLGFASNNILFGVGAWPFAATFDGDKCRVNTRDLFGLAMKATNGVFGKTFDDGTVDKSMNVCREIPIFKDPKTDTNKLKKSHKGAINVYYNADGNLVAEDGLTVLGEKTLEANVRKNGTAFRTVFVDGKCVDKDTFTDIRNRLAKEVM